MQIDLRNRIATIAKSKHRFIEELTKDCIIEQALAENPWFTRSDIEYSVLAIADKMLCEEQLTIWTEGIEPHKTAKNIAVICAGNIPLVAFNDILAVVVSGNHCHYKLSSKDSVLMTTAIDVLRERCSGCDLVPLSDNSKIDAVIATGSNNTGRYFKWKYGNLPLLVRGSRHSIAIIDGSESDEELSALWDDIFQYYGLGCRNVNQLVVPKEYTTDRVVELWSKREVKHPHYLGSYRQNRALLTMQNIPFTDGGYYILKEKTAGLQPLSEISIVRYGNSEELHRFLTTEYDSLQCIVSKPIEGVETVGFGEAQKPTLADWADGINLFDFLNKLN